MADLTERIRRLLASSSSASSAALQELCDTSQASISRSLAPLLASGEVLRVGRGRNQTYVMPRQIEGVSTTGTTPIMKVDARGKVSEFGTLIPAVGGRCWVEEFEEPVIQLHDGLPWFLADMRPQGFLGRAFAYAQKELRLAENPNHWTDDDILKALSQAGNDLPGNLIVGARAYERFTQSPPAPRTMADQYPDLAEAAMHGAAPGSSAGGEQPKFCTVRQDGTHVIVKFSPAGDSAPAQRWRDLLVCEHLALSVLNDNAISAARSSVFQVRGRVFLEVERFDRTILGRIGMVSLLAFDSEYIGQMDNWAASAERMVTRNLLRHADADRLRLLEAYGRLIGNSDRHYGNISLLIGRRNKWELAPAYDMLPMTYAPVASEIVRRPEFDPGTLASSAETIKVWDDARRLATEFWSRVAAEATISDDFRAIAERHVGGLEGPDEAPQPAAIESAFLREATR
jgi:hypothetical protein